MTAWAGWGGEPDDRHSNARGILTESRPFGQVPPPPPCGSQRNLDPQMPRRAQCQERHVHPGRPCPVPKWRRERERTLGGARGHPRVALAGARGPRLAGAGWGREGRTGAPRPRGAWSWRRAQRRARSLVPPAGRPGAGRLRAAAPRAAPLRGRPAPLCLCGG